MSYTALYRKWRPDSFDEVKGQDAIVKTLKNQILSGRIGHAYLFCGTRGTGKTSVAKLLGKAVNCENPVDGEPCGKCKSCQAIAAGNSMNVVEMDAASNNGVEDVRQILTDVSYPPAEGKFKVYIIDEVHMLSISAFNALLKTLEEPPAYVIFILATTESHKIPVTILSRCQRYDFKRISQDVLCSRLNEVMAAENITADERAVSYIAKVAEGGMRDALSLLDQCVSLYYGQHLTYDMALEALGAVDTSVFSEFLRDLSVCSVVDAVKLLSRIVSQGRDLSQFIVDFTWYLRNVLMVCTSEDAAEVVDATAENLAALKLEAKVLNTEQILRYIRIFSNLSNDLRYAAQKRILIEMTIVRVCKPEAEKDLSGITDRLRLLEADMNELKENGSTYLVKNAKESETARVDKESYLQQQQQQFESLPSAEREDLTKLANGWTDVVKGISDNYKAYLRGSRAIVRPEDGKLMIGLDDDGITRDFLIGSGGDVAIKGFLEELIGKSIEMEFMNLKEVNQAGGIDLSSVIHFAVEYDDTI